MKKQVFLIVSLLSLLSSCTQPGLSSSLSSSGEASSSSSSSSVSTYSEVSPFIEEVAKRSAFYNSGLTSADLINKANISPTAALTFGNLVRVVKAAFDDFMPELKGIRRYSGVYALPVYEASSEELEALTWMCGYGLWGDDAFFGKDRTDMAFVGTLLARFYQYFGTNPKDDFYAYANHDFLYESTDDINITSNDSYIYQPSSQYDEKEEGKVELAEELLKQGSPLAPIYQTGLDYLNGTWDYSFADSEETKEEVALIRGIASLDDIVAYETHSLKTHGACSLLVLNDVDDYVWNSTKYIGVKLSDSYELATTCYSQSQDALRSFLASEIYSYFHLESSQTDALVENCVSFSKKLLSNYYLFASVSQSDALYSESGGQDIFSHYDIPISLSSLFDGAGIMDGLYYAKSKTCRELCSLGKTYAEADTGESIAYLLMDFLVNSIGLARYKKGMKNDYSLFSDSLGGPLAYEYAKLDECQSNFELVVGLLDEVKTVFGKRIEASSWLSSYGKTQAKGKLDALRYNFFGWSSHSESTDYSIYDVDPDVPFDQLAGINKYKWMKNVFECSKAGVKSDTMDVIFMNPFRSLASYYPTSNSMVVNIGYAFLLGRNLLSLSKESLFSGLGTTLAHELTHGFDSYGIYFDKDGTKSDFSLFSYEDTAAFNKLGEKVVERYANIEIAPGIAINSKQLLGEAIADLGSLSIMIDLTKEQKGFDYSSFFIGFAQSFLAKMSRAFLKKRLLVFTHPMCEGRINPLLSNCQEFIETFSLQVGDPMYLAPTEIITIW